MPSEPFDLVRAQLEAAKRRHAQELNRALYASVVSPSRPAPMPRWTRAWRRVRAYLSTLWQALRGRDPYDDDWSDY